MRKPDLLVVIAAALAVLARATTAGAQVMRKPESKGYAKVNDVELYFEVHGDGPPLIMLHGGVTPSEMLGAHLAEMAAFYKLLGGSQRDAGLDGSLRSPNRLAIIPNTTHMTLLGSAALTEFAAAFLHSR